MGRKTNWGNQQVDRWYACPATSSSLPYQIILLCHLSCDQPKSWDWSSNFAGPECDWTGRNGKRFCRFLGRCDFGKCWRLQLILVSSFIQVFTSMDYFQYLFPKFLLFCRIAWIFRKLTCFWYLRNQAIIGTFLKVLITFAVLSFFLVFIISCNSQIKIKFN